MTGFRTVVLAAATLLSVSGSSACVEVPDSVRAQFADPRPDERNNFRKGAKGFAPPVEDAPVAKAAPPAEARPAEADAKNDAKNDAKDDAKNDAKNDAPRDPSTSDGGAR